MTAKYFFQQVAGAERRVQAMAKQVMHMRNIATNTSMQIKTDPVVGSGGNHSEDMMISYADSVRNLEDQIGAHLILIHDAETVLDQLPSMYDTVLRYRYLCGMRWQEIMACYPQLSDIRQLYRIHGYALVAAQKVIDRFSCIGKDYCEIVI
jgi:hypothetical protein